MASTPKTGDLLLQARLIDEQQLETALGYQQARGGKLGEILVSLNYVSEQELLDALAKKLSLPILSEAEVLEMQVSPETRGALPRFLIEEELGRGELVCFAPGPRGAHKVTNRGTATARVMMFSSAREPAVAVYPDSDKVGVWPGNPEDNVMLRRSDGHVDYWEGER